MAYSGMKFLAASFLMSSLRINTDTEKRLSFLVSWITSCKEDRNLDSLVTHLCCCCGEILLENEIHVEFASS